MLSRGTWFSEGGLGPERFILKPMNENKFAEVDFKRNKSISKYIGAR